MQFTCSIDGQTYYSHTQVRSVPWFNHTESTSLTDTELPQGDVSVVVHVHSDKCTLDGLEARGELLLHELQGESYGR